jgi:tetraacyldisaccharide 4'-kinase
MLISDDGLQHYRLPRNLTICVVDGIRRHGNGHLLPAGPLREPPGRLQDMDYVVCNGGQSRPGEIQMSLSGDELVNLATAERQALSDWRGRTVHAVAGIGHPGQFFDALETAGLTVQRHAFPDHHEFTRADFDAWYGHPLIMTEKDAVKCTELSLQDAWYLPVSAVMPLEFEQALLRAVRKILSGDGSKS